MRSEDDWMAERTLVNTDGRWYASIGRPVPTPGHEHTDWSCAYALRGPQYEIRRSAVGLDSFQSLLLALAALAADAQALGCHWAADGEQVSDSPELTFPDYSAT